MSRPLDEYRRRRDFAATPEPKAARGRRRRRGAPVFLVHRHDARRLHWDLRLEMAGVLCSWAVPRGFSYDSREKRLAVRTEDHPLAYQDFEGVIPEGEYGAGTMGVWDRGTYEVLRAPDGRAAVDSGELKVVLRGRKLRGEWHLVRTAQEEGRAWLLFKSGDRYAGPARDTALGIDLAAAPQASLPRRAAPMQCGGRGAPFSDPAWVFEMAFAGRRTFAEWHAGRGRLSGLRRAPADVLSALAGLRAETARLDGVLVALDDGERPDLALLERALAGAADVPLVYYAFDLLHWEEFDLRPLPLTARKAALRAILPEAGALLYVDHVPGNGEALARAVAEAGLPGLVAKRADAEYRAGLSPDWRAIDVAPEPRAGHASLRASLASRRPAAGRGRARITNPEKVYWPAAGYTKADLIAYYDEVADALLPYLADRAVHMNRFPDGIEGKSFYQRHANETLAPWVRRVDLESESQQGERQPYVVCDDRATLLHLAGLGSIDLHPWLSRVSAVHSPDWAVLDLDPNGAPFAHVVILARRAGELLAEVGLRPLVKTSGKSGLHVYLPLAAGYDYEHSRTFCEIVARLLCRERPDLGTVERTPARRGGRVYLDFLQNRRGQTVVPPYVPRPVPSASVSTPLQWDELDEALDPRRFTIRTLPERLASRGDLFAPTLSDPQHLGNALHALEERLRRRTSRPPRG